MLLNTYYLIENIEYTNELVHTSLRHNIDHDIFKGHFPASPVVPGVCMMQMVKEIMESLEGKRLMLCDAPNVKFLSVLDPNENSTVDSSITIDERLGENLFKITASITAGSTIFFKLKATLKTL